MDVALPPSTTFAVLLQFLLSLFLWLSGSRHLSSSILSGPHLHLLCNSFPSVHMDGAGHMLTALSASQQHLLATDKGSEFVAHMNPYLCGV